MKRFWSITPDPYRDADAYEDYLESQYDNRPFCDGCGEKIRTNYGYNIDGKLLCETCFKEYVDDNIRENMENYDEEEYDPYDYDDTVER